MVCYKITSCSIEHYIFLQSLYSFSIDYIAKMCFLMEIGSYRIKDTRTGKVVFQLPKRYGKPYDVGWNGQYLIACLSSADVLILDCGHIFK